MVARKCFGEVRCNTLLGENGSNPGEGGREKTAHHSARRESVVRMALYHRRQVCGLAKLWAVNLEYPGALDSESRVLR